ncbi:unnamed protein product [Parnassius mnemosyne]|uniref:Uncharacterized protein n=1 Tax=Parnassius mnemosyne TaxID=213953 RepID=A0AAV1M6A8_9NEOP
MPKVAKSAKRQSILQVYAFCEREQTENKLIVPLQQVRARAAMTDVLASTVTRILKQERETSSVTNLGGPSKVTTPGKKLPNRDKKINDIDACAIRQKIMSFDDARREIGV